MTGHTTKLTVSASRNEIADGNQVHPLRTQTRRVARYDRSEDHGHTLPTVLLARLASSQLGNEVRAVFPGLLQRVEDGTGVGIVIDAEPDERAAEGRE